VRVEKSWGFEEIIHNGDYCCKKLVYTRPISSSLHYHEKKHETFVVSEGEFVLEMGEEILTPRALRAGDYVVLKPGTKHRLTCMTQRGTVIEASTHDDPEDCVRLIPSQP
jgi:mannose-6-phosphate isomerase-like protein (cupin superfamily)